MPDTLVIALDPGHGGSNEGLKHLGLVEKDMNNVVANAMKDTLLQYDQVEVYITNPDKADMSLKQRAEYAKSVGADIVISLHFNMSEEHEMYGSEVWIPSQGLFHAKMHSLGDIFMEQFSDMGMTLRGVKTRLNDRGTDYYGIIRESVALNMPCILVEHGYADHAMDFDKVNDIDDWKAMGVSDATAVAKFFRLKSSSLATDYSDYVKNGYFAPEEAIGSDTTEPVSAAIVWEGEKELSDQELNALQSDEEQIEIRNLHQFRIGAADEESELVYYSYSLDGGESFSEIYPFERDSLQMQIEIPNISAGAKVCARIYNGHFLYATTECVTFQTLEQMKENGIIDDAQIEAAMYIPEVEETAKEGNGEQKEQVINEDRFKEEGLLPMTENKQEETVETAQIKEAGSKQEKEGASLFPAYLVSGLFLFLAMLLFFASFLTAKAKQRRYGRVRMRRCLLLATACCLAGILGFSVTSIWSANRTKDAMEPVEESLVQDAKKENMEKQDLPEDEILEEVKKPEPVLDIYKLPTVLTAESENNQNKAVFFEKEEIAYTTVYDIAEGYMRVPLLEQVRKNPYQLSGFKGDGLSKTYQAPDGNGPLVGIDVSKFQGDINWEAVSQSGVRFAIMRLGVRGYGSGDLVMDEKFYVNQQAASEMGLMTGVYFFSQAISEEEAVEEANFVLQAIEGLAIDMPIVFDTEPINYDVARTDNLTPNQLTRITKAFCDTIRQAGYQPMIYANAKRFTTVLHLDQLTDYSYWLADYRKTPDYPYDFSMWQFTEKGQVPGIDGNVDIDLYFPR